MALTRFPDIIIIDVRDEINEFLNVVNYDRFDDMAYSIADIEEALFLLSFAFLDWNQSQEQICQIHNFVMEQLHLGKRANPGLFGRALYDLAYSIATKLHHQGVYWNGLFPYSFERIIGNTSVVFKFEEEMSGESYLDLEAALGNSKF